MPERRLLPQSISGYNLNGESGYFTVVVAEESRNRFKNNDPAYFVANAPTLLTGSTASLDDTYTRRGPYSSKVVSSTSDTGSGRSVPLTAGGVYTVSADVKIPQNIKFRIEVEDAGTGTILRSKYYVGTDNWQRVFLTFTTTNTASHLCRIRVYSPCTFYMDGWQIEDKDHPTTYLDGSMSGYIIGEVAYGYYNDLYGGSFRIKNTKSGGREIKLSDMGFYVTGYTGLGIPDIENVASDLFLGGSFYQRTVERNRTITIVGSIFGRTPYELEQTRKKLIETIYDTTVSNNQPMLLKFHKVNNGIETGEVVDIPCFYESGLSLINDNLHQENLALTFIQYTPDMTYDTIQTNRLNVIEPAHLQYGDLYFRDTNGKITRIAQGTSGTPLTGVITKWLPEATAFGVFNHANDIGGVSNSKGFCLVYNGTIIALGTGVTGGAINNACAFKTSPVNYKIAIVGTFTSAGGVANTANIAVWENGSWTSVKTSFTGSNVLGCTYDEFGNLYVVGTFTAINGVSANNIAYLSVTDGLWHGIGTGLDSTGRGIIRSDSGVIYCWGNFNNANGINTGTVCRVLTNNFEKLAGQRINGAGSVPGCGFIGPNGELYIGGEDMGFDGVAGNKSIVRWNGGGWFDTGFNGFSIGPNLFTQFKNYLTYQVNGTMPAILGNGKTFNFFEIQNGPTVSHFAFNKLNEGVMYMYNNFGSSGWLSGYTEIANSYKETDVVSIYIVGPLTIRYISVENTNSYIRFVSSYSINSGLVIGSGEVVTIEFSGNGMRIKSSSGKDYSSKILSKSSKFVINSGTNYIKIGANYNPNVGNLVTPDIYAYIKGVNYSNTQSGGYLYYRIAGASPYTINVYKDSGATELVASSATYTVAYTPVVLSEANGSGISGIVMGKAAAMGTSAVVRYGLVYIGFEKKAKML